MDSAYQSYFRVPKRPAVVRGRRSPLCAVDMRVAHKEPLSSVHRRQVAYTYVSFFGVEAGHRYFYAVVGSNQLLNVATARNSKIS